MAAGTVIVWDRGTWTPIGDAHKGYAKGHLEFDLRGEKLGGHGISCGCTASRGRNARTGC